MERKSKIIAGLLAIFLGEFGIHKFYLGRTTEGIIMLLITVLTAGIAAVVVWAVGLIEGIIYLTKSEDEFHDIYVVGGKRWF